MGIIKQSDIVLLKPFHRNIPNMPKPAPEREDKIADLDPDLKPEEQSYVNHYVSYADILLSQPPPESTPAVPEFADNVIEMPKPHYPTEQPNDDDKDQAA